MLFRIHRIHEDLEHRPWYSLLVAVGAVGCATVVKFGVNEVLGDGFPFMTYFLAVPVVAAFVARFAGYLTVVLSALVGAYFFVPPVWSLDLNRAEIGHSIIFTVEGFIIVYAINQMHKALDHAEEAIRVRDYFLAIVSHDLRNPLSAVRLQAESTLRKTPDDRGATKVLRAVDRMTRLIDQMVDVSKATSGRPELKLEPLDLKSLVEETVQVIASHTCEVKVDADSVVGHWDRTKVEQVITNLLTNACKYGEGRPVRIKVTGSESTAHVLVIDEGPGIPAAEKDRLFRRFQRLSNANGHEGIGLGLWTTRQLLKLMGGSIEVDSEPGRGTTFTVGLPRYVTAARSLLPPAN